MHTLFSSHQRRRAFCCFSALLLLALSTLLAACGSDTTQSVAAGQGTACPSTSGLQGSGSTFDNPLFSKMFAAYAQVSCGTYRVLSRRWQWSGDERSVGTERRFCRHRYTADGCEPCQKPAWPHPAHPRYVGVRGHHLPRDRRSVAVETHRAGACQHLPGKDHLLE